MARLMFCSSEKYLLSRYTGKDYHHSDLEDEIARKLRFKSLSFNDYNEEKTSLLEITPSKSPYDFE